MDGEVIGGATVKKTVMLLALLLCLSFSLPAQAVTIKSTTTMNYREGHNALDYLAEHPEITIEEVNWDYYSTLDLTSRMTTRSFEADIYLLRFQDIDRETMMRKGFCMDLSGSKVLMELVGRMYPNIVEQIMFDGGLYAWPDGMTFSCMRVDPEVWEAAGLTRADIPDSFPAFLEFAESWCDRLESDPNLDIHIMGGMDGYGELFRENGDALYVDWLLELLIHQVVAQQQYAGEELHFDDEEIKALIRRCDEVGRRIYRAESNNPMGRKGMFMAQDFWQWPRTTDSLVYLRLNDSQPRLIEANLRTYAVNPATKEPDTCLKLMEAYAASPVLDEVYDLYFYADKENFLHGWYEKDMAGYQARIGSLRERLEDETLSEESRFALEDELAFEISCMEEQESRKWVLHPEALEDYRAHIGELYFAKPNVLTEVESSSQIFKLRGQVSRGAISVEQFIQRLCDITSMMRQEQ